MEEGHQIGLVLPGVEGLEVIASGSLPCNVYAMSDKWVLLLTRWVRAPPVVFGPGFAIERTQRWDDPPRATTRGVGASSLFPCA